MSIFGAMFSGVTGLDAQSQALGMIADNISNVNTIGYKGTSARFATLVTQQASRTNYTPGGVQSTPFHAIDRQGLLQSSGSRTDIAIAGQGFFVVNEAAQPGLGNEYLFTRAGSFNPDENGNLVNTGGYYLQGWPLTNGALPSNTSVLTSVQTVNISNLAGTARATQNVNLALNLPSTAPAAAGGGQINSNISATALAGITDIDFKSYGAVGQVGKLTYVAATKTMTIDIGGQTGTFDLSAGTAQIYKSTGTLSGMEVTVDGNFDFNANITTQVNTVAETNGVGAEPGNFTLATNLTGIDTISLAGVAADQVVTVEFDSATGVLTLKNGASTGTVNIGTSAGTATKDFTITSGPLNGTVVTINTATFNYGTSFTDTGNVTTGTKTGGTGAANVTFQGTTGLDAATIRLLDSQTISFTLTQDDAGAKGDVSGFTGPTGFSATVSSTLDGAGAKTAVVTDGTNSFTLNFTTDADTADGETLNLTFNVNELKNSVASDADNLVVAATTPTVANFDATDLAALSTTALSFNVDANGRVSLASGPTGFSVDQAASNDLATTGLRTIVLTDGTNAFTVTLDITTAITQGSADIAVDLLELQNSFGLGAAQTGGKYFATVQIFDSLGNAHDLVLEFDKTATNTWQLQVNDPVLAATGVASGTVTAATRSVTFSGDGTPSSVTFPAIQITNWTTGANDSTIAVDIGAAGQSNGVTQFAGDFSLSSIDQDGVRFGGFTGVSIDKDGIVTAVFDNGEQFAIFQLPIAMFANPNGLDARSGNAFGRTDTSGDLLLQQANAGGAGTVASSALEAST
ncbi:MAG: flagellar hook-basal body complex protein, partial [Kiloniellaceae bacterium]